MSDGMPEVPSKGEARPRRIAIACQGGGTHAAFTWGVLTEILLTQQDWTQRQGPDRQFEVVGLSGTSAGALCALAAWYGLVPNQLDPSCGTADKAVERLDFLWHVFAAKTPAELWHNRAIQTALAWKIAGVPSTPVSPSSPQTALSLEGLKMMGVRPEYLGFDALLKAVCPHFDAIDWAKAVDSPRIIAGAMEVLSGNFEVFDSRRTLELKGLCPDPEAREHYDTLRWRMRRPFSLAGVAASGTLPEVQPARRISDSEFPTGTPGVTLTRDALYWDGLYSQNPPVRELVEIVTKDQKPDEIWVVRINPQELRSTTAMTEPEEIEDRRNELAGNVSLNQELDHILSVNRWLHDFADQPPFDTMKPVTVRTIKMRAETAYGLRYASKLDRSRRHLDMLAEEGRAVARDWLAGWRELAGAFPAYPADARYDTPSNASR